MSVNPSIEELIRAAYRPLPDLVEQMEALMRALAETTCAIGVVLRLNGSGTLLLDRTDRACRLRWQENLHATSSDSRLPGDKEAVNAVDEPVRQAEWRAYERYDELPASSIDSGRISVATPLPYGGRPIGELSLSWPGVPEDQQATSILCREFARECAFLIKRYDIQRFTEARFGVSMLPVGMSRALRAVERFIERASWSPLPVLISGERGTEKIQTAVAIHHRSVLKCYGL